jgi:hypothetical protein
VRSLALQSFVLVFYDQGILDQPVLFGSSPCCTLLHRAILWTIALGAPVAFYEATL